MRQFLSAILLSGFLSCNSSDKITIEFPDGGYAYPLLIDKNREEFFYYQFKDSLTKDDSLRTAYYGGYFFKALDEPNLSLKYYGKINFRFVYEGPFEQPLVINFTENEIVIKEGVKGVIYPKTDESKFSEIERQHFSLLRRRYPLTDSIKNKGDKQYIDSMLKLYPSLMDPSYYMYLLKKIELPITEKFIYTTKRINISKQEFLKIVDTINRSGYWNFPFKIECGNMPTDVSGYSLEANTIDRYKIVTELDCDDTNFKILCRKLVSFAKVKQRF